MTSRYRSISSAAARSIECTTSAKSTVTCLYFAVSAEAVVGAPHSSQNLAFSLRPVPHDPHAKPAVIRAPPIQESRLLQLRTIGCSTAKSSANRPGVTRLASFFPPSHQHRSSKLTSTREDGVSVSERDDVIAVVSRH